ncbi:Mitochondrial intermediate peptidase [Ascosphaera atra]|nr:Mitochondrial intermediate peptidase [Ascosphaera atra]
MPDPPGMQTSWQGFFSHLFGYGATYYSYLLDRALAGKIWAEVFKNGEKALDREAGERMKNEVLKWGGGRNGWECVANVLGDVPGNENGKLARGGEEAMREVGTWGATATLERRNERTARVRLTSRPPQLTVYGYPRTHTLQPNPRKLLPSTAVQCLQLCAIVQRFMSLCRHGLCRGLVRRYALPETRSESIWITDDLLEHTIRSFVAMRQQRRRSSNAPRPLETGNQATQRRAVDLHASSGHAFPLDIGDVAKRVVAAGDGHNKHIGTSWQASTDWQSEYTWFREIGMQRT